MSKQKTIIEKFKDKIKHLKERKHQLKILRKNQHKLSNHSIKSSESRALIKQVKRECNVLEHDIKEKEKK